MLTRSGDEFSSQSFADGVEIAHQNPRTDRFPIMSSITIFTFSILLISPFSVSSLINMTDEGDNENPIAYEVIQSYGFPKGILPIGVTGYELDKSTGKFKAFFNGSCSFSLEGSYDLKYKWTIGGIISKGRLKELTRCFSSGSTLLKFIHQMTA
ncbi:hypothetical protein L1887_36230 [Cichorium endivia]|nr:hypothetical protein L1887_36230 [Cichorium endivia]